MTTIDITIFIILIFLQIADFYTTKRALKLPGNYEKNRWLRWLMDKIGLMPALIIPKAAAMAITGWAFWVYPEQIVLQVGMGAVAVGNAWVVWKNYRLGDK